MRGRGREGAGLAVETWAVGWPWLFVSRHTQPVEYGPDVGVRPKLCPRWSFLDQPAVHRSLNWLWSITLFENLRVLLRKRSSPRLKGGGPVL